MPENALEIDDAKSAPRGDDSARDAAGNAAGDRTDAAAGECTGVSAILSDAYDWVSKRLPSEETWLKISDTVMLNQLEKAHFQYFLDNSNATTGLTLDRSSPDSPSSIAATGFALTAIPIGAERGWISREEAGERTLKTLRTLWNSEQSDDPTKSSGKDGFFYHFLNADDCTRHKNCEISTIDTALLMSGVQFARSYFDRQTPEETEIRDLGKKLYERVDWTAAVNGEGKMSHGWTPEAGMIPHTWSAYDEGTVLMLMAAGSPTHPIDADVVDKYYSTAKIQRPYGQEHITFGPLFGHQYAHSWVDFRGVSNDQSAKIGIDLFENSRRAALAQNFYAQDNPHNFKGYSKLDWGLTACDGPGYAEKDIDGSKRTFQGYMARGFPDAPDDGTIAPTAATSSLPFAPDIVLPTLRHWTQDRKELLGPHGFYDAFNPTFDDSTPSGWIDKETIGIDQGASVLAIENYRSQFVWNTMRRNPEVKAALKKAGFKGGWLESP